MKLSLVEDFNRIPASSKVWLTILLLSLSVAFKYLLRKKALNNLEKSSWRKKSEQGTLLILGECGSGKTQLYYRLTSSRNWKVETVTSMQPNVFKIPSNCDNGQISISDEVRKFDRIVDFPGHRCLRTKSDSYIKEASKIIYMVDASDKKSLKDAAEGFLELLEKLLKEKKGSPILVACNKSELRAAKDPEFIKLSFSREIEKATSHKPIRGQPETGIGTKQQVRSEKQAKVPWEEYYSAAPILFLPVSVRGNDLNAVFGFLERTTQSVPLKSAGDTDDTNLAKLGNTPPSQSSLLRRLILERHGLPAGATAKPSA